MIGPTSRGPSRTMGAISGGVAFPSQGKATPPNQHQGRGACKMATPPYYRLWYEFLQSLKARTSDSAMEIGTKGEREEAFRVVWTEPTDNSGAYQKSE